MKGTDVWIPWIMIDSDLWLNYCVLLWKWGVLALLFLLYRAAW